LRTLVSRRQDLIGIESIDARPLAWGVRVFALCVVGLVSCSLIGTGDLHSDDSAGGSGGTSATTSASGANVSSATSTNSSNGSGTTAGGCGDTLSDPLNCGACGHDCWGAECVNGACELLEVANVSPQIAYRIAANKNIVYFVQGVPQASVGLFRSFAAKDPLPSLSPGVATGVAANQTFVAVHPDLDQGFFGNGAAIGACVGSAQPPPTCASNVAAVPGGIAARELRVIRDRLFFATNQNLSSFGLAFLEPAIIEVDATQTPSRFFSFGHNEDVLYLGGTGNNACLYAAASLDEVFASPTAVVVQCGIAATAPADIAVAPNGAVFYRARGSDLRYGVMRDGLPLFQGLSSPNLGAVEIDHTFVYFDAATAATTTERLYRCPIAATEENACDVIGPEGEIVSISSTDEAVFYTLGNSIYRLRK
jgi:hypothetical protein